MVETITYAEFEQVDIRVGTITDAQPFPQARKPAYRLVIDFGAEIGEKRSSAQLTVHYRPESLVGRQVAAVVNFPPRQIGKFIAIEDVSAVVADRRNEILQVGRLGRHDVAELVASRTAHRMVDHRNTLQRLGTRGTRHTNQFRVVASSDLKNNRLRCLHRRRGASRQR
jgi:tRNA-binding protein